MLGAANVTRTRLSIGEVEYLPGMVLYDTDSLRRLEIFWSDTLQLSHPQAVRPGGARSQWRVPPKRRRQWTERRTSVWRGKDGGTLLAVPAKVRGKKGMGTAFP